MCAYMNIGLLKSQLQAIRETSDLVKGYKEFLKY